MKSVEPIEGVLTELLESLGSLKKDLEWVDEELTAAVGIYGVQGFGHISTESIQER